MLQKWICKECGFETEEKPEHKNSICPKCGKARLQGWNQCEWYKTYFRAKTGISASFIRGTVIMRRKGLQSRSRHALSNKYHS